MSDVARFAPNSPNSGEGKPKHFRRFPHLRPGDRELLDQLGQLSPAAARAFERELECQHDSDVRQVRVVERLRQRLAPTRRKRPTYPPHD